jgi:hypothetical protein
MVSAKGRCEGEAEGASKEGEGREMERVGLVRGEIWVEDKERNGGVRRQRRLESGNRVGNGTGYEGLWWQLSTGGRERDAVGGEEIKVGKDMITKTGGACGGVRETGRRSVKEAKRTGAGAYPTTGVDSVAEEGSGSRAGLETPRVGAPLMGNGGEVGAAIEVSRQVDEQKEGMELVVAAKEGEEAEGGL